jgi:hypothetical protein
MELEIFLNWTHRKSTFDNWAKYIEDNPQVGNTQTDNGCSERSENIWTIHRQIPTSRNMIQPTPIKRKEIPGLKLPLFWFPLVFSHLLETFEHSTNTDQKLVEKFLCVYSLEVTAKQNITITVLVVIHRPALYLKRTISNVRTSQETHYVSATNPTGQCDL